MKRLGHVISSESKKVEASECVTMLVRSLYQSVGNKRFIFNDRLTDLSGMDAEALCMLARALRD